jgi:hypothetical protein
VEISIRAIRQDQFIIGGTEGLNSEANGTTLGNLWWHQQAMPTNVKGVEVTLDTIDPNGNFIHIDTVTSDSSGMFKKMWTPDIPGEYTVIATFAGSKFYWSSYAETAIGVSEAPPAPTEPQPAAAQPPLHMYLL